MSYARGMQPTPDPSERRLVARVGAEAWRGLSSRTRRALVGGAAPAQPAERALHVGVVCELRGVGLAPEQIACVYAVSAFGGLPDDLDDLIREADARIAADRQAAELAARSGRNFVVELARRGQDAHGVAVWGWALRRRDTGALCLVRLRVDDLKDPWSFERACMEQANFRPLLASRDAADFHAFVAAVLGSISDKPARAGRLDRAEGQAGTLLALLARELAAEHGGAWQDTPTALWQALADRAARRGGLPPDWPPGPASLVWALRRANHALASAGIQWCRGRHAGHGRERYLRLTLRRTGGT